MGPNSPTSGIYRGRGGGTPLPSYIVPPGPQTQAQTQVPLTLRPVLHLPGSWLAPLSTIPPVPNLGNVPAPVPTAQCQLQPLLLPGLNIITSYISKPKIHHFKLQQQIQLSSVQVQSSLLPIPSPAPSLALPSPPPPPPAHSLSPSF